MGTLTPPSSGMVYLDANCIIYSVEKHPVFGPLLLPIWQAAKNTTIEVVSSELVLLETLVGPLKSNNVTLVAVYEQLFRKAQTRLLPISQNVLRAAAQLRATTKLKTPDAVHAATALDAGCSMFVTNDRGFRTVTGLPVLILDDLLP